MFTYLNYKSEKTICINTQKGAVTKQPLNLNKLLVDFI